MKILWFPKLQFDADKLHITTWREMCGSLEDKGVDVKIAIAGNDVDGILDRPYIRIPIIRIKFLRIITFWVNGYFKFIQSYLAYKPDVTILDIYSIWFSFPLVLLPKNKRKCLFIVDNRTPMHDLVVPNGTSLRDRFMRGYTKLCYSYCGHFLDAMTVINSHYKSSVCEQFGFKPDNIGIWGSGVNLNIFSPQKYQCPEKPNFLKGKFVVLQHGALTFNRGLLETVEAIGLTKKTDIALLLIGDGPAKDKIFSKIKDLQLEDRVYILEAKPYLTMPSCIAYCDCAVMAYPSTEYWQNNSPIKLLEYFAMGKVVVCTNIWSFRDTAGDHKCVRYITDNHVDKIAQAITHCYDNRQFLNEWGKEGIGIVNERYTWDKQAQNLLDFIKHTQNKKV